MTASRTTGRTLTAPVTEVVDFLPVRRNNHRVAPDHRQIANTGLTAVLSVGVLSIPNSTRGGPMDRLKTLSIFETNAS